ncbi:TIM-barrel domain-containing protein [Bifidobacterium sp. ESL0745]|uniref:glycoside hydrolase family 31 protein n=1 Tax=Bifidobacterium sp. ESL0745 TaxID=2983226 RepID=UPI0023F95918|nr:TIM-barrel domain-containing protein [Bifidobacterium sp. ESL0745]MDF7665874.1 glycoside hydrolase family 31 protein [Bifidobacterium sp. ESL0745]
MSAFPQLRTNPAMDPACVIQGDQWRIGIITDSLLRLEWQEQGEFEDDATQVVVNRNWGAKPQFTQTVIDGQLVVDTPHLSLTYDMGPFSKEGLSVVAKGVRYSQSNTWNYGEVQRGNLGGTARTLDGADGAVPLGTGVISRDGWAVMDDSKSNLIVDMPEVRGQKNPFKTWIQPREHGGIDIYVFAYGHRYIDAVADYYRLTGETPLLPRFVLGNWWSRYHKYSESEYLSLMDRFDREGLPFTTAVIDMDWHRVDDIDPKYGSGWTGYSWNRKLFPDPPRFLSGLHKRGIKTTLNIHPRDGIRAFEDQYPEVAESMGIDKNSGMPVSFDLTSPKFMQVYFNLHHKLEDEGVDFWWLDWQQGGACRQKGLDPLWMLNHMHYLDSGRDGRWPLTFSRFAGPGSHRYPVGFSGDTIVTWKSLQFQPYFTATASNIGYGWWSHDIGGHMFGYRDEELQARWYQLGTFSPITRLHSTASSFNGKEPWNFRTETRQAMTKALRLRQELIPYLYTMNWRAHTQGRPLVEPMYWQSPENIEAYSVPDEFRFGTELVAAPITSPMDRDAQRAKANVWLPQGTWFDFFTGRRYEASEEAGRRFEAWRGLQDVPVFAKAGAIVPLQPLDDENGRINSVDNPRHLRVLVFPGADGSLDMYEDDGIHDDGSVSATTAIRYESVAEGGKGSRLVISSPAGSQECLPELRDWTLVFRGVEEHNVPKVFIDGVSAQSDSQYDAETLSLSVHVADVPRSAEISLVFADRLGFGEDRCLDDAYQALYDAQIGYRAKDAAAPIIKQYGRNVIPSLYSLDGSKEGADPMNEEDSTDNARIPDTVIRAMAEHLLRTGE